MMAIYGHEKAIEKDYREVGPDTWIYLFDDEGEKLLLISVDYTGDYEFEVFPHLLKFDSGFEFVLQREIPVKNGSLKEKAANTILFEYTD